MSRSISDLCRGASAPTQCALVLLLGIGGIGLAFQPSVAAPLNTYLLFKGGVYSPSATFNLDNVDLETTLDGNTQTGVNGEIALGHHVLPTLALELGVGYFKGKGSFKASNGAARRGVDFNVVPVLLSAKAFIPAGPISPFGELGVGAYFTKLEVTDNLNSFSGTQTLGMHLGGGLNANLSPNTFLGVEGRYVWANPSFGEQKIKLNDTEYALNGFKLNGFTTTVGLGFHF